MCIVHGLLSKIPQDLPFEQLISKAGDLYLQYPPSDLAYDAIMNFKRAQRYMIFFYLSGLEKTKNLCTHPESSVQLTWPQGQVSLWYGLASDVEFVLPVIHQHLLF